MTYLERSLRMTLLLPVILAACNLKPKPMDVSTLNDFATRYTAAWCSHNAASVASFYEESGSLKINQADPSVGRAAITEAAQGFMTAFPDIVVKMDRLDVGDTARATYHWTLTGTNTGPGGTGNAVRISGYEQWRMGDHALIAESKGHFDEAEYQRQLKME
jgi:ketosteroid isomerase-like protein